MSTTNRNEANRKIAEWLGWTWAPCTDDGYGYAWFDANDIIQNHLPDFYTSEEASALVLEKMPDPVLFKRKLGPDGPFTWECRPAGSEMAAVQDPDRKTAIAEATLKLIESEEK